jgi:hypothetical protein
MKTELFVLKMIFLKNSNIQMLLNIRKSVSVLWIVFFIFHFATQIHAQSTNHKERSMAVFLPGQGVDENYQANLSSVKQILAVSGIPSKISASLEECLDYGVIMFAESINENTLTEEQKGDLINFVFNGGGLILPGLTDSELFEMAGIEDYRMKNRRYKFSFKTSLQDPELRWIDEPYEKEVKLGGKKYGDIFPTLGYYVSSAEVFASYEESNQAAIIKNKFGNGLVYTLGVEWRDVIIRNLLDRDYQANRIYSNAFEATADVFMLLVRGMYTQMIPNAVWLSPAPYDSKAVYIITHDVCSHSAHIFSNDFAQMELDRGVSATYNITTHKFIDDINGDNYSSHIPQMRSLLIKGHTIGSHSFGHFPDFADGEIFPKGEPVSYKNYSPHFSVEEGRTVGGTAFGELGVSKQLLERDLNTEVLYYRSGHLAVNPMQYDVVNELGYRYSSTYSAADLLTGFPFYAHSGREMNGEPLPLIEIPLAISDVFGSNGTPIDEFNWMDKSELWLDVMNSYANNNALTLILIHPNRKYKLDAMNYVFDHMASDIYTMGFGEYAEFWKEKEQVEFSTKIEGNKLKIYANDAFYANDAYSLIIDQAGSFEEIELYNSKGELMTHQKHDYYLGTSVLYQKGLDALKGQVVSPFIAEEVLYQNVPNPFSFNTQIKYNVPENAFVSLKVFDMYGREVGVLVQQNQLTGIYELDYNTTHLPSGVYFYQIQMQSEHRVYSATRKMLIRK